ncbi:hypothetical protein B0H11DRAFT_1902472 [Mycena galericulata]|nr:hypothetical protein B0H11DRAFT_1902472 [Mycena galericulata]
MVSVLGNACIVPTVADWENVALQKKGEVLIVHLDMPWAHEVLFAVKVGYSQRLHQDAAPMRATILRDINFTQNLVCTLLMELRWTDRKSSKGRLYSPYYGTWGRVLERRGAEKKSREKADGGESDLSQSESDEDAKNWESYRFGRDDATGE